MLICFHLHSQSATHPIALLGFCNYRSVFCFVFHPPKMKEICQDGNLEHYTYTCEIRQILIKFIFPLNAQDPQQCFVFCEELFFSLCRKRVQDCTGIERIFIIIYCVKFKRRAKLAAFQEQEATPICKNGTDFCSCLFCSYCWLFCSRRWCWDM